MSTTVDFRVYSAATGAPLAGLVGTLAFYDLVRENSNGANDALVSYVFVDEGNGRYSFVIPDTDLLAGSTVFYVIDCGANAAARYLEGAVSADDEAAVAEASASGYTSEGIDQKAEVLYNAADSVAYFIKKDGASVAPDAASAFVTIYDPGGTIKVARTAAVITGSKLSYSRTWEKPTFELWEDFVALFEWAEGGAAKSDRLFFDVVRSKLPCLIDESDILEQYPDAEQHLKSLGITDATRFIKRAWSVMMDRIRSGKNRPSLILDRVRLINPAVEGATARMCRALAKESGDIWHERMTHHFKEYNSLMAGLGELKYDKDEDGFAAEGETKRLNRRTATV